MTDLERIRAYIAEQRRLNAHMGSSLSARGELRALLALERMCEFMPVTERVLPLSTDATISNVLKALELPPEQARI